MACCGSVLLGRAVQKVCHCGGPQTKHGVCLSLCGVNHRFCSLSLSFPFSFSTALRFSLKPTCVPLPLWSHHCGFDLAVIVVYCPLSESEALGGASPEPWPLKWSRTFAFRYQFRFDVFRTTWWMWTHLCGGVRAHDSFRSGRRTHSHPPTSCAFPATFGPAET